MKPKDLTEPSKEATDHPDQDHGPLLLSVKKLREARDRGHEASSDGGDSGRSDTNDMLF